MQQGAEVSAASRPVPVATVLVVALLCFALAAGAWVVWQLTVSSRPPAAFRERTALPQCPNITVPQGQPDSMPYDNCLLSAQAQGVGAEVAVTSSSTEGEPFTTYYRVLPRGGVEVFVTSSADSFGSGDWGHLRCPDVRRAEDRGRVSVGVTAARSWHRPTGNDVAASAFWMATVLGVVLAATGDADGLTTVIFPVLLGTVAGYHRVDEEARYAERFSCPPDAPTQLLVHESVSRDQLPPGSAMRELALDYATGWSRRLARTLRIAAVVTAGSCLACGLLVWLLDGWWPESTPTRAWGFALTVIGAVCWLLTLGVPCLLRLQRLRRLRRLN